MAQIDFKRAFRTSTFGFLFAGLLAATAAVACGDDDDDDGVTAGSSGAGGKAGSAGTAGNPGTSGSSGAGGAGGMATQGTTIQVTANYSGSTMGKFYWALLPDAGGMPGAPPVQFGTPMPTFPGAFSFSIPNVAPGSYFVGAFIDTTGLGEPRAEDPQDFLPVTVAAGQASIPVTLNLAAGMGGGGSAGSAGSAGAAGASGSAGGGGAGGNLEN